LHKKPILRFLLLIAVVAVVSLIASFIVIQREQINTLNRQLAKIEAELRGLEARLAEELPKFEEGAGPPSKQVHLSSKAESDFMVWNRFWALFFTVVLAFITMFSLANVFKIFEIRDRIVEVDGKIERFERDIERFERDYADFNDKFRQQIASDRIFRNLMYLTNLFASHKRISAAQDLINEEKLAYETFQFIEKVLKEELKRKERDKELVHILQQIVNKFKKQFDC